jgi:hypothetical protein
MRSDFISLFFEYGAYPCLHYLITYKIIYEITRLTSKRRVRMLHKLTRYIRIWLSIFNKALAAFDETLSLVKAPTRK